MLSLHWARFYICRQQFPVKSVMGEDLNAAQVTDYGLFVDLGYSLLDNSEGNVATARNPRKGPGYFNFRAALIEPSVRSNKVPRLVRALVTVMNTPSCRGVK